MNLRERALSGLSRQLGHPSGGFGRLLGGVLNRRNSPDVRAAVSALAVRPGATLLDVGFGGGLGVELLLRRLAEVDSADGRVHGVDVSETMIASAGRRFRREVAAGRLLLQLAPMEDLPIPDTSVDAAITLNTIYFLPDLPAAFTELRRVLHSDGQVVVGLGDPQAMERMAVTRQGFRVRPVAEVIDALRAAGLTVTDHRRVGTGDGAFHLLLATPATSGES